jgi:rhamnulokinase
LPAVREAAALFTESRFVAAPSHETASAFAAADLRANTMVISSGTWSLIGLEVPAPIRSESARPAGFINEAGACGTARFLRNASGMCLVQECRRAWQRSGRDYSYAELEALGATAQPLRSLVDPNHSDFPLPEDMPDALRSRCRGTGQAEPADEGQLVRVILESLALSHREALDHLVHLTGQHIERIQIVGGGSNNALLNRLTADARGRPVEAGPVEATAIGNLMTQIHPASSTADLESIRALVRRSFPTKRYEPSGNRYRWDEAYQHFLDHRRID